MPAVLVSVECVICGNRFLSHVLELVVLPTSVRLFCSRCKRQRLAFVIKKL